MAHDLEDEFLASAVISNSNVATAIIRVDGVFEYANAAFSGISGFPADELTGLRLDCLFADAVPLNRDHGELSESRQLIRKDRSLSWVRVITAPAAAPTVGHHAFILQLIDIEQQKQFETALLLSESRMNFALEAARQGVWDHDILADTIYFSPGWRKMRGIPAGEAVDGSLEAWIIRIHPDDRQRILQAVQREMASEYRILEYRERHRDGRYIWVQSRGQNVAWDQYGNATRTLGTDTDITDRKSAEEEFQQVSRRLDLALDASKVGVWEQDLKTSIIIWDRRMNEIYERDPAVDLQDSYWEKIIHPDDRHQAALDFSQAVGSGGAYSSQFRICMPSGGIKYLRSRAQVFENADGSRKIIGTEWDVTADVRLNEELQRAKALAESRYADLNAAQAQIQYAALHDELTDLPNRRFLNQVLLERRSEALGRRDNLAALHIDLDWFKEINDRLGHAAGDVMLQHVANLLRANVREGDFIARIGGDEFVMLCWFDGDIDDLSAMAERIIRQLREYVPYEGQRMRVGASIGIAYEVTDHVVSPKLLRDADVALYRAKNLGRNRYEFAAA